MIELKDRIIYTFEDVQLVSELCLGGDQDALVAITNNFNKAATANWGHKWQTLLRTPCIANNAYPYDGMQFLVIFKKKEKKLVPFTKDDAPLFAGKWVKSMDTNITGVYMIIGYAHSHVVTFADSMSYERAMKDIQFTDGSPFGKYVEE